MTEHIVNLMAEHGYLAVFLLMVIENIFPPIPSEVVLPYVGHLSATGEMNLLLALFVAAIGSLVGTSFWFMFGWLLPTERLKIFFSRFGGYIAITVKDFEIASRFFARHEGMAVFFGRMIPAVRSVISIPAGSVRMSPSTFLFISFLGIGIWNIILVGIGYVFLSDPYVVQKYVNPISDLIILAFVVAYLVQVVRFLVNKR